MAAANTTASAVCATTCAAAVAATTAASAPTPSSTKAMLVGAAASQPANAEPYRRSAALAMIMTVGAARSANSMRPSIGAKSVQFQR